MSEISQLRIFARVVEAGSFSEAGRQLGVAPSSISRQINDHEDKLGVRLFHRTTRKLTTTEAGETYYARVRKILDLIEEARLAISESDGRPAGVLRITVPTGLGRQLLVTALPDFLGKYSSIRVILSMTDSQLDIVGEGIDVAIRLGRLPDSSLKSRKIGVSRRIVCASPSYLHTRGSPKTPSDLEDHNCLTWRAHPGTNLWKFRGREGSMEARVSGNLFAQNADALVSAAASGLGIVLLPDWNMGLELREGLLRPILENYEAVPGTSPIHAVFAPRKHMSKSVRVFTEFLATHLANASHTSPRNQKRRGND